MTKTDTERIEALESEVAGLKTMLLQHTVNAVHPAPYYPAPWGTVTAEHWLTPQPYPPVITLC